MRAVQQQLCTSAASVHSFLSTLQSPDSKEGITNSIDDTPLKCVVKPVQSAGSDDVFLCSSRSEALTAFEKINGKRNGLGLVNEGALVQEFLAGKEYVIDQVGSRPCDSRLMPHATRQLSSQL